MKATIISYLAGMGGDFLSFQIHKDSKFFPIDNLQITHHNMWMFPNLLEPIGSEAKIYPSDQPWAINEAKLEQLNLLYGDRNILLPTHWYNTITPAMTNNLFNKGIRLYAKSKHTLKICLALWWIKSHVIANEPWDLRKQEIDQMIINNHPKKHLLGELKNSYHNWKFLSIKYNIYDANGSLDLLTYVKTHFNKLYTSANQIKFSQNYTFFDIDDLYYTSHSNVSAVESYFDVKLDLDQIHEYSLVNQQTIKDSLGVDVDHRDFGNDDSFFQLIVDYAESIIEERIHFNDYYNGKRISKSC